MSKINFILNIVTNIIAAIIIWGVAQLIRGAKNLFTSGTVTTRLKTVFTTKRINICGSLITALFNLWILGKFVLGQSSFSRFGLLSAIILSFITLYWTNRVVAELRSATHRQLEETRERLYSLESREKPRSLSETQRTRFMSALKTGPAGKVDVSYIIGNDEAFNFASELVDLLKNAGWVRYFGTVAIPGANPSGLIIRTRAERLPAHALLLQQALETIGFDPENETWEHMDEGEVILIVGRKPGE